MILCIFILLIKRTTDPSYCFPIFVIRTVDRTNVCYCRDRDIRSFPI